MALSLLPATDGVALQPLLLLLGAAALVVAVLARWRLPSALGYLMLGAVLGPHALGGLPDNATTHGLAELGVAFLMFIVGLEFSLSTLLSARRLVFGLGGLEVAVVGAVTTSIALALGLTLSAAVIVGGALAMSSTAIVLKQLRDTGELNTRHGRLSLAVLIFQDLATLPLLAVVPALALEQGGGPVLLALGRTVVAFIGLSLLGHWLARPLIRWVAALRSPEVFTLAALCTVVGAAALAQWVGLTAPLGAFLAGMVLGETEYRHQLEADIQPFQAVLLGLFFASIGMLLEPAVLLTYWLHILGVGSALVVLKAVAIITGIRAVGHEWGTACRVGVILGHGGEFGLLVVSVALGHALLPAVAAQIVLAAIIGSMFVAPLLIQVNGRLAQVLALESRPQGRDHADVDSAPKTFTDHVIICGFGRCGQNIAQLLSESGHPYVALDLDPARCRQAQQAGVPVIYGNASHPRLLAAAGTESARALVVTLDESHAAERVTSAARTLNAALPILVRTRDAAEYESLIDAGATDVLPEGLEASLMIGGQVLALLGTPNDAIGASLAAMRAEHYRRLRRFFHAGDEKAPATDGYREHLRTVTLSPICRHLSVGQLTEHYPDLEVTAIIRAGVRSPSPTSNSRVLPGDVLELCGPESLLEQVTNSIAAESEAGDGQA